MRWLERKWGWLAFGVVGALVASGAIVAVASPPGHGTARAVAARQAPAKTGSGLGRTNVGPTGGAPVLGPIPNRAGDIAQGANGSAVAGGSASASGPAAVNGSASSASPDVAPAPVPNLEPQVVRTGDLTLQVTKGGFQSAFDRASTIAQEMGGFVVSSSVGQPGPVPLGVPTEGIDPTVTQPSDTRAPEAAAPTSGSLDLRVPGNRFNDARHALEGLATKVLTEQLTGNDASGQLIDLSARISNLEAEEVSLRTIETRAGSISDVLQVQNQLTQVRSQIEELKAEQSRLGNEVALASLHVQLQEPGVALAPPTPKPRSELARSWSRAVAGVEAVTGGMLVVLGYTLPVAGAAVLAWLTGGWALRRRRGAPARVA